MGQIFKFSYNQQCKLPEAKARKYLQRAPKAIGFAAVR
jgi:hypothetical protein